jgi:hypothetical protein
VKFPRDHESAEFFSGFFYDVSDVPVAQSGRQNHKKKVGVEKEKVCLARLDSA